MSKTCIERMLIFSVLLFCLITTALTGCGKSANSAANDAATAGGHTSTDTKAIEKILQSADLDGDLREILQSKSEKPPATSFDLIEKDFESGTLTREEAVLLKLTAAFAPDKLVGKYSGAPPNTSAPYSDALRRDIQWIMNNFEAFDEALQEKFKPFILKPDDPDSFFNPENKKKQESILQRLAFTSIAYASDEHWQSLDFDVAGKPNAGTIYYRENTLTADGIPMKQKAQTVKEALEKAWPMYKALLHVQPDRHLAFYLTDLRIATSNQAGSAYYTQDKSTKELLSFYIVVDWSLSGDYLKSVSAHELFHIFQYHSMKEYEELEAWWLQEATAVWAENYVYPLVNREHSYLDMFFGSLEDQLINKGGSKDYAGYMLFFFLSERYRNNSLIADIILTTKGYDVATYIMNALEEFPDTFAQFALWNWNAKPWKNYSDNGTFPAKRPYGTALQNHVLQNAVQEEDGIVLPPGAIGYKYYHIADNNIKRVKFDFTDMPWDGNIHVQALYKVGDQWLLRDCTDANSVIFCRSKPSENIKGVVLVFSNADLKTPSVLSTAPPVLSKQPLELTYVVDTTGECPQTINGYTKITETMTYRNGNSSASMVINYYSEDELEYDEERDTYVITKRSLSYTLSSDKSFPDTAVFGLGGNATSGSGTLVETYELSDAPVRFERGKDGGGYLTPDPETKKDSWVKYNDTVLGAYEDNPMGIVLLYLGACGGIDVMPEEIKEKSIKGNRANKVSVDAKMEMETSIEFSYSLK